MNYQNDQIGFSMTLKNDIDNFVYVTQWLENNKNLPHKEAEFGATVHLAIAQTPMLKATILPYYVRWLDTMHGEEDGTVDLILIDGLEASAGAIIDCAFRNQLGLDSSNLPLSLHEVFCFWKDGGSSLL